MFHPDYRVLVKGKEKVFHANMLKRYVLREETADAAVGGSKCVQSVGDFVPWSEISPLLDEVDMSVPKVPSIFSGDFHTVESLCSAGVVQDHGEDVSIPTLSAPMSTSIPDEDVSCVQFDAALSEVQLGEIKAVFQVHADILTTWPGANFYKSLYTQTVPTPESTMKSSPDTEEIPEFTAEEVERAIKRMKRHKAQGVDGITSDIIKLGGPIVLTYLINIFNNILKTKQSPDSWHEAKIVILFKKGDPKDIKNYRPISLVSHSYKIFTRLLQTRIERTLDENQPREQAGFRKGYSTTDHLQALNQIIEKSNECNLPLCIGFIDYEKAFDTVEHFAIFEALRKTNVNETYINILQNIYNQATARVHLDKLVSTEFLIYRGVRQGDSLSPKLFTAVMEEVFKKADISYGANADGENLTNLRFADDVALFNETTKQMEKHLNNLNSESLKVGLKIHKGKTKYMTNHADSKDILIDQQKIEKVTEFKYLGQNHKP